MTGPDARLERAALLASALGVWVLFWTADLPRDPIPYLIGLAALCVVGLTRRTAPAIAWLGCIAGAFTFAGYPIAAASRANPAAASIDAWLGLAGPAGASAIVTLLIAVWYATRPERRPVALAVALARILVVWLTVAVVVTWVAAATGQRSDPAFTWIDVATIPIGWYVRFVAVAVAIGVAADVGWAARRAAGRSPRTTEGSRAARAWTLGLATLDELLPRRAAAEARVADERRRIAGDLHASVVPSLRRAIAAAEGEADPAAVLRHLRTADLELERLMTDRWPVVLESFGLVAALEDLAERLEAEGAPAVHIDVEQSEQRPPKDVERAAWRIAQIGLDNAVRHAAARTITVSVATTADRVRLAVGDDGGGDGTGANADPGGRGIPDAVARAAEVGGRARVGPAPGGGTVLTFIWPASGA